MGIEMSLMVKRVYEPAHEGDGYRVLVDRIWPRGLRKDKASVDLWLREIGPSAPLRKWFDHRPERWEEFKVRYSQELDERADAVERLRERARTERVTLLFGSRETRYNNAQALKEYLERTMGRSGPSEP